MSTSQEKLVVYTLDGAINDFFKSHLTVTRKQCDVLAASIVGEPVEPVPIQGSFSYTVTAGNDQSKIVQFRSPESTLDTNTLDLARNVHGKLVPSPIYHGRIGHLPSQLHVYIMDKIPGSVYVQAQSDYHVPVGTSLEASLQHANTVADIARFFAQSWNNRQTTTPDIVQATHNDYRQKLQLLSEALPSRFTQNLQKAIAGLELLFTPEYPWVLGHGDLSALNIMTEPSTGHITGIIDWAEAQILPFGMNLWGLENVLGYMNSAGWYYYSNHRALEEHFWQTFQENAMGIGAAEMQRIGMARMTGTFLRYGFRRTRGEDVVDEGSSSFKYLEAFCCSESRA
ncbi:hypothetical protein H634G_09028 [Metarhizium anisopliae BRIP 53293]|uniref:Aminoglycoside phosphotransferase domain-containing protein n=1 Tax=Metarhizium anisopliae BRIP 53293 TaxID=1291518 RepID=A0A0D9NNZ6_METAN|nr:hypothetical protein H634G_09028 [Metarhizium anisopliae BRIP 53293]KJK94024.1 hypothetical protein H633G_02124 [Metarhizium anisopliae BRIP 53284]